MSEVASLEERFDLTQKGITCDQRHKKKAADGRVKNDERDDLLCKLQQKIFASNRII